MTQSVTMPDGSVNNFPDEATPEMISAALGLAAKQPTQNNTAPKPEPKTQEATPVSIGTSQPNPTNTNQPAQDTTQSAPPPSVPMAGTDHTVAENDPVNDKLYQQTPAGQNLASIDGLMGLGWLTKPYNAVFQTYSDIASEPLGLSEKTQQKLRDSGWFNDYEKDQNSWTKSVFEGLLKPAAAIGDALIRGPYAATTAFISGVGNIFAQEEGDTASRHAIDFTNFLYIHSGFDSMGKPLEKKEPESTPKVPEATTNHENKVDVKEKLKEIQEKAVKTRETADKISNAKDIKEGVEKSEETEPASRAARAMGEDIEPAGLTVPLTVESKYVDRAGNINLNYINKPEDVKQAIREVANNNGGASAFMDQRRGIVSHETTLEDAQKLVDQTANGIPTWIQDWPVGKAPNNAEGTATRIMLGEAADNVTRLAKVAKDTGTADDIAAWKEAVDKQVLVQRTASGMAAESGRGLNAFGIAVPGGEKAEVMDTARKAKLTEEELLDLHAGMDTPQQAVKFLNDAKKASFSDALIYYVMNNYLSGPITHGAYAASFMLQSILRAGVETPIESAVGMIQRAMGKGISADEFNSLTTERSTLMDRVGEAESTQGRPMSVADREIAKERIADIEKQLDIKQTVMPKEAVARFYGMGQGFLDAVKASAKAVRNDTIVRLPGEAEADNVMTRNSIVAWGKTFQEQYPMASKLVQGGGQIAGIPMRLAAGIHTFQKFFAFSEARSALAYRKAASEGLTGDALSTQIAKYQANMPPELIAAAKDEGMYASLIAKPTGKLAKGWDEFTHANNYVRSIAPFSRVMNNLNKQVWLERTPIGLGDKMIRDNILGRNGNVKQAESIGRMATGSIILGAATTLAATGRVIGGLHASVAQRNAETDDGKKPAFANVRSMNYLAGNVPYSVRIGDHSIPLRFLGQGGRLLGMGADMHDISNVALGQDHDPLEALGLTAASVGNNFLDESSIRGIGELFEAVTDAKKGDWASAQNYMYNAGISAFSPASVGMGQMTRMTDPYMRLTKSVPMQDDEWYSRMTRRLGETMESRVPFASQTLVPNIDIFGNPMKRSGDFRWAENDPVMQTLQRVEVYPAPVGHNIGTTKLDEQQWSDYAAKAGKLFYMDMTNQIANPNWMKLDDDAQSDIIRKSLKDSRQMARCYMSVRYPDIVAKGCKQISDMMGQ